MKHIAGRTTAALSRIGALTCAVLALALAGCVTRPPPVAVATLMDDALFPDAPAAIDTTSLFAMSEAMRAFADRRFWGAGARSDKRDALLQAFYDPEGLEMGYDAAATRTAAETFDKRAGNCLSLVVMTAAFAKYLELPVAYQSVVVEDAYDRRDGLLVASGHVNVVLGQPARVRSSDEIAWLTIDFLPQQQLRGQRALALAEHTVVAMYLNNLAADALAAGRMPRAYAYARDAVRRDPSFLAAANTLAVVYQRAGHLHAAERALRHVLERDPRQVSAWTNLVHVLTARGEPAAAAEAERRLAQLQPQPPFWNLDRGREAMTAGAYDDALRAFERERRLQPYQHEVHFWLAQAHAALGHRVEAERHLEHAAEYGPTPDKKSQYSAKLARLRHPQALP